MYLPENNGVNMSVSTDNYFECKWMKFSIKVADFSIKNKTNLFIIYLTQSSFQ